MNRGRLIATTMAAVAIATACSVASSMNEPDAGNTDSGVVPFPDAAVADVVDGAIVDSGPPPKCPPNTDYQNDARNCSRCGHDCLSGACSAGVCQPFRATSSTSATQEILVVGNNVYYTNANGEVIAWPIGDETSRLLATNQGNIQGLATDGIALYWVSSTASGSISRCELLGCGMNPTTIAADQPWPFDVTWDPARKRVLWTNHMRGLCAGANDADASTRGDIRSVLADGGDPQILVPDAGAFPSRIAATGHAVYWTVDRCAAEFSAPGTLWSLLPSGDRNVVGDVPAALDVLDLAADDAGTAFSVASENTYATGPGPGPVTAPGQPSTTRGPCR